MPNGKQRGTAPLMLLNIVTGATAVLMAAAGLAYQTETINIPVGLGGILQLVAIGGIGIIWWLVRGAFNDLRERVVDVDKHTDMVAERVSYLEGILGVSSKRVQRSLGVRNELIGEDTDGEAP